MNYLIDTNVVSELRRPDKAHPNVVAWSNTLRKSQGWISAITLFELEYGCQSVARRDTLQGRDLRRWIDVIVSTKYAGRILSIDAAVAKRCAQLHVPNPRPDRDAFIAATALVHGFAVVTRNVADFAPMGVDLINPWS